MSDNVKVSILIPVYNRVEIIEETIVSALNQTYENIEIIIVDNCSDDGTEDICRSYERNDKRVKFYRNEENLGPVLNWLECLKKSNGEYIKFLWSDDWMDNNFIEETIPFLKDSRVAFAYTAAYIVSESKSVLSYSLSDEDRLYSSDSFEYMSLFGGNVPVSPGCAIFRKRDVISSLLVDIPNDDELDFKAYGAGNDMLIYLLTLRNYQKVAYVGSSKSYFRSHKGSFTINNKLHIYYDWARLYYIKIKNDNNLLKKFKSVLFIKRLRKREYKRIYESIKICLDFSFLVRKVFARCAKRISRLGLHH